MADAADPTNSATAAPAAPVVDAVVPSAPVADTTPSASATDTSVISKPADTGAPIAAQPVTESKAETPTPPATESVLGDAPKPAEAVAPEKKVEVKPADDKAAKADTPTEAKPEAVKPEFPVYEAFKVPEGVTLEKEPLDAFTKILGEIETGKLDHLGIQEKGQALIDLAAKATTDSINRYTDSLVQIHNDTKKARFEALKADAELGGDKLPDTIATLQRTIGEYAGTEAQIAEFRKEVSEAGVDASPALCRLIYNMQQKINSYTTETGGNRMVPGQAPAPSKVKDYQRFYTGSNG